MFEISSVAQTEVGMETAHSPILSTKTKRPKSKSKPKTVSEREPIVKPDDFSELTELLNHWNPSDAKASRDLLVSELLTLLEEKRHACMVACIPAVIVDGKYPIEIMHYNEGKDIDEFITRMLWIHHVFKSSIGFLIGVPDDETANRIEEACRSLLNMDQDCIVQLL